MSNVKLCVNVDHIATLRQARGGTFPDPVKGAMLCEENGADGITVHLREDRRHIQDFDVYALRDVVNGKFNLEMALSDDIISIATQVIPDQITLVPEKREELTTEGGLNVKQNFKKIREVVDIFHQLEVEVSLFIEPEIDIIDLSFDTGSDFIELHTGTYCNAIQESDIQIEKSRLYAAASHGLKKGIRINAGHGLNYNNITSILDMEGLEELNIGHSIIYQSIYSGLPYAVKEMVTIIQE